MVQAYIFAYESCISFSSVTSGQIPCPARRLFDILFQNIWVMSHFYSIHLNFTHNLAFVHGPEALFNLVELCVEWCCSCINFYIAALHRPLKLMCFRAQGCHCRVVSEKPLMPGRNDYYMRSNISGGTNSLERMNGCHCRWSKPPLLRGLT